MGNVKYEINFEHDDNRYRGVAQISQTRCSIELESMPGLEFRFPIANSDDLMVALPSDKKGRKPLIACSVEEVPILADAIEAVMSIRQHGVMQLKSEGLLGSGY